MKQPSSQSKHSQAWKPAKESDPLLSSPSYSSDNNNRSGDTAAGGRSLRRRASPTVSINQHFGQQQQQEQQQQQYHQEGGGQMNTAFTSSDHHDAQHLQHSYHQQPYEYMKDGASVSAGGGGGGGGGAAHASQSSNSGSSGPSYPGIGYIPTLRRQYQDHQSDDASNSTTGDHPPLLEIPEEIYGVRKSALQVLKPLTKTWLVVSVGFALTVLFGMARWTGLLLNLPFWFILLPSWLSHVGLFWCHIMSAKALSSFIAEANDSRQRSDSRDQLDRTEYLPLLQRSLKFGLKTGLISFGVLIFEILVYFRLARGNLSLSAVFLPFWIMVFGGIVDGIICKTQHFMRLICWVLAFAAMLLACLKVDYGYNSIRWRMIVSPIVTVLSISSAALIYIVYGHQVGYYRLTESQLTAGNLYSLAALISIVLVIVIGEVIPMNRPVEIETRVFVVLMAPLVVTLVGMGAWVVSRDEYGRLLLYGGQAAIHPRKLRWEAKGWTCVQGRGVTNIPMFGEVSFRPLEKKPSAAHNSIELCLCCTCYPLEEDEEEIIQSNDLMGHPYLTTTNDHRPGATTTTTSSIQIQRSTDHETL